MEKYKNLPFVSVIVPCRNEEKFIAATLENIISQDYPSDSIEVFVVDGVSTDNTKDIVLKISLKHSTIHVLDNVAKIVPHALNMAIKKSRGEIIIRMDAHSVYPDNYISSLVRHLIELKADNVGGVWITEAGAKSATADAIAAATSHPFGIGNAHYRLGAKGPAQVDTVPFGCYRRDVFEKIGFFDQDLIRNQDDEFNGRLIKSGGKIFLIPSIGIRYFARENISKLSSMFYQYGLFKPLVNIKLKYPATYRQLAPPLLLASLLLLASASIFNYPLRLLFITEFLFYLITVIVISLIIAIKKGLRMFIPLLGIFPAIHFSYGAGYLKGIIRFSFLKAHKKQRTSEVKLSR